jgi:proteasome lid subunit RPN8/RPN11
VIHIGASDLAQLQGDAEQAYPFEACGLLVGHVTPKGDIEIVRVVPSPNVAAEQDARKDRFEIDPKLRFDVMRACEGKADDIVGHYHSHPDHPAEPSAIDLSMAYDKEYVWVIAAVAKGQVTHVTAHRLNAEGDGFVEIALKIK